MKKERFTLFLMVERLHETTKTIQSFVKREKITLNALENEVQKLYEIQMRISAILEDLR